MYLGKNGERFPKEIFDRLSTEEQKNFKFVEDKDIFDLIEKANKTDCDLIMGENNTLLLKKRVLSDEQKLYNEKLYLEAFLDKSNYIAINYGALRSEDKKTLFLAETSDTFGMTNEEIFDKRVEAIARINELKEIIKK